MLLVLYDSACPFCARCREWLEAREHEVPLAFLCCRSRAARERFGTIPGIGAELVVIDERGRYWVGPAAFLACGWALRAYRWLACIAAWAIFWPIAREIFRAISDNRGALGGWIGAPCTGEHCGLAPSRSPYR